MQLAVAVSGGADSTALLLHAAQTFPRGSVIALAVDHRTRPQASAAERRHIAATAARLGIACHSLAVSPAGHGHAHWREARLGGLVAFCRAHGVPRLWLGQHADDALETAAIRLLAGGPLESLAGISAARSVEGVRIERPLLGQAGRRLRRGLMAAGLGWAEDPSNRNPAYKRAAVRQVLAASPADRPGAAGLLRRIADWRIGREQAEALAWHAIARVSALGAVSLDAQALSQLPPSLTARLLRRAARVVTGADHRLRNADFVAASRAGPPAVLGGALLLEQDGLWWVTRRPDSIASAEPLRGGMEWDCRCRLTLNSPLPPGGWTVEPVRGRRIGSMHRLGPAAALDALPAVAGDGGIVAIPPLGLWRGAYGKFWAASLCCSWIPHPEPEIFRLVP